MSEPNKEYISHPDEMGNIHISEMVLAGITAAAVKDVEGVSSLAGGQSFGGIISGKKISRSIAISFHEERLSIGVAILIQYGSVIPDVGRAVQEAVMNAVENTTGLKVDQVNVHVVGISFQQ